MTIKRFDYTFNKKDILIIKQYINDNKYRLFLCKEHGIIPIKFNQKVECNVDNCHMKLIKVI